MLNDKQYNILKWIAQILLPALGALYFALGGIWGLPNVEQVVGTIAAVDAFLGVLLGISTSQYEKNEKYDGDLLITDRPDEDASLFSLELTKDPADIAQKKDMVLRVKSS